MAHITIDDELRLTLNGELDLLVTDPAVTAGTREYLTPYDTQVRLHLKGSTTIYPLYVRMRMPRLPDHLDGYQKFFLMKPYLVDSSGRAKNIVIRSSHGIDTHPDGFVEGRVLVDHVAEDLNLKQDLAGRDGEYVHFFWDVLEAPQDMASARYKLGLTIRFEFDQQTDQKTRSFSLTTKVEPFRCELSVVAWHDGLSNAKDLDRDEEMAIITYERIAAKLSYPNDYPSPTITEWAHLKPKIINMKDAVCCCGKRHRWD
ncbi:hypothetical protein QBC34DRAFT_454543 [Podospora aff. communis PSN243]|uniref:Uncharacterized protein n=1 Tax=Podospora aff. communis PSN243 TaxID=3040156 RepID=A0AAV9G650_9PEZI|nr:hypothetical protein QBC34DRAFT_454543 [Podospora aff. communis PSN243]